MEIINKFKDKYAFLSNTYKEPLEYDGNTFQNVKEAFKFQKEINDPRVWNMIETDVMYDIVWHKFSKSEKLKKLLLSTGDKFLININQYGDKIWGICDGRGDNRLGFILMNIRWRLFNLDKKHSESFNDIVDSPYIKMLSSWDVDIKQEDLYQKEILQKIIDYYGIEEVLYFLLEMLLEDNELCGNIWDNEVSYISELGYIRK